MNTKGMRSLDDVKSCVSGYDAESMRLDVARDFIGRLIEPIDVMERLPIRTSLGRVLARDIVSPIDVPAHDNSAMDGYAFHGDALEAGAAADPDAVTVLAIAGSVVAGQGVRHGVDRASCVRIMTGAPMPDGMDTVVPQESVELVEPSDSMQIAHIRISRGAVARGDNRRRAGEDLAKGTRALLAGKILKPADLGLLASLGMAEVSVYRQLRVAFFSTGNELCSLGEPLAAGCVYDSNRYTLWSMLTRLGVDVLDLGVIPDEPDALHLAFQQAAEAADVVITSGGVGPGEADHTREVMARVGDVAFWSVAIRPGRPLAIGTVRGVDGGRRSLLFGLPGNPVAVMTTFYALVRDALLKLSGSTDAPPLRLQAISVAAIKKRPGRTEYQRARVRVNTDGRLEAAIGGSQGSGVLRSMSEANAFVVLAHEQGPVAAGDTVEVLLFDGLV